MEKTETVKSRLERMAGSSKSVPKALASEHIIQAEENKPLTPSKVMQQKIEKSIRIIEGYHLKMNRDSESYLALFYDLKKAEKEFMELLKEAEVRRLVIPSPFMKRIEAIRAKIDDRPLYQRNY